MTNPTPSRPRFLPWQEVLTHPADPGLADDLRDLLSEETTDDMVARADRPRRRSRTF